MTGSSAADPAVRPLRRLVCVALNASIDKIAAVERLVPGEVHRPDVLSVVPGGKALNVARAASNLGLAATVVPVVAGHAGAWLVEALAARGMPTRPVRVTGETRTCLSVLDRSTGKLTELYEAGPALDAAGWAAVEAAIAAELEVEPDASVVVVSGSLPPGAPADAAGAIVRLARATGARCAVDVGGAQLGDAVAARPWLARVNAAEAADATGWPPGGEAGTLAAARALHDAGAEIVLVSRGVEGAIIVDRDGQAWRVGPPPELGRYPVGSGDSMLAGFVAAIAAGSTAGEAGRHGTAAAAANAMHPGQGEFDTADVARMLPRVTLEQLEA